MIITCNNCNKRFELDSSIIPEKGRLLQCIGCSHKWFFKKKIINQPISTVKINKPNEEPEPLKDFIETPEEDIGLLETESPKTIELLDSTVEHNTIAEKISIKVNTKNKKNDKIDQSLKIEFSKNKKSYNILGLTIVFIISFTALIIVFDTFQKPIGNIIPNIEFLLYSLYQTINDIVLFFKDLI